MNGVEPMRIAVIGVGSAGIQALCHHLSFLPPGSEVVSIHDPNIPNLGIGESTNPAFVSALEKGLNFDIISDLPALDGTYKLGTQYINWREHEFLNPLIQGGIAVHFNTNKLTNWAMPRLKKIWGDKFNVIHGTVRSITSYPDAAFVDIDGKEYPFDYIIDCRGMPKEFDDSYQMVEHATVNHGLIHNKMESVNPMYTGHHATQDGWMFQVPLANRNSYGYLFNNTVTDPAQARINFAKEINVSVSDLDNIEYQFKSYFTKKIITGRIIKNGNLAAFFEPMFANSLFIYDIINRITWDFWQGKGTEDQMNDFFLFRVTGIRDMIDFHYHGGSTYNTPFWERIIPIASKNLKNSLHFEHIRHEVRNQSVKKYYLEDLEPAQWVFTSLALIKISQNFGYRYFEKEGIK